MTLDEIRHQLATARAIPKEALGAAAEQAEALVPEVLRLMELAGRSIVLTRPEERLLGYGVHVLAAARRTELYEPLLRLTEARSADFRWLLFDASLDSLLISSLGPESKPPYGLLTNPYVHGEAKTDLFLVIAWMVWQGRASRDEFIAFLDRFDREAVEDESNFAWYGWQQAISLLRLTDFEERIRLGWEQGRARHDNDADREELIRDLHRAAGESADEALFKEHGVAPIEDVPQTLRAHLFFGFDDWNEKDEQGRADPARDIRPARDELLWLEAFLQDEDVMPPDAMNIENLDGFLSGLAAGPEDVPLEEWWPRIWSDGNQEPAFETDTQEPYVRDLIGRHLEAIRRCLKAGYWYEPLVDKDSPPDDIEAWAIGFATAMDVRPGSWDAVGHHRNAGIAAASIVMLLPHEDLADGDDEMLDPLEDDERQTIAGNLPQLVHMCYAFWHGLPVPPLISPRRSQKIGRNEPCPCGSGRKYKKCCGAN
jgi:uncharacterized protein